MIIFGKKGSGFEKLMFRLLILMLGAIGVLFIVSMIVIIKFLLTF